MVSQSHARLLVKAASLLGGEPQLRSFLRASHEDYERWMQGEAPLPSDLFLKVADLVSEHNRDFFLQLRTRQDQLRQESEELIGTSRAIIRSSEEIRGWSIVLRAARASERDSAETSPLRHLLFDAGFVPTHRGDLLEAALDATLSVAKTDLGNVQIIDADGALRIVAHRGLSRPFLDFFAVVSQPECACGVAMSFGRQLFIEDVRNSSLFAGTVAGKVLLGAGCAAVTSTPLVHPTGLVMGMISTHYREPRSEQQAGLPLLNLVAKRTASWLDARAL